ncbi:Ecto-5'-nucleotidase 2 [Carabus blaptoides fortunei]
MKHYNKSVAYAKSNEIVAYAYANRSAVLFQNKLYKECLIDIEYAFENGYPEHLHTKLNERRDKAQKQLEESEESPKEDYFTQVPSIEENCNEKFECASDRIEMKCTEDMGRHLIATKKIEPGDIIAVEKPYTNILLYNFYLTHCHHCLLISYNLVPCCKCPLTLYCSKICRDHAWERYHQYECSLLDTLHSIEATKLQLLALRVVLCARKNYPQILKDEIIDEECSKYKSECYKEIHELITNEEHRPVNELFARSTVAAVLFHLLDSTSFFNDLNDGIDVEEIKKCTAGLLLRHLQTAPSNMHEISEFQGNVENGYEIVEIGAGAYSFMSLLNHSCAPNVVRHCHGTTIVLRAIRPIEIGQQLYDNYGYHHALMVRDERRSHLKEQYWFTCECEACVNDWPLYNSFPTENADLVLDENELSALSVVLTVIVAEDLELLILHNNDMHSRFEETNKLSGTCSKSKPNECYGGFARVAHVVREAREKSRTGAGPKVLYLNAGDTYTGTAWFTVHRWKIAAEFLNILNPDAMSLGNHEFDDGVKGLVPFLDATKFPVVSANLDLSKEPSLAATDLTPSHIITVGNHKIGVIGYLTPETTIISQTENVIFNAEVPSIKAESERLKQKGVNTIIAVGHSGFEMDKNIAENVPLVDVVIGGHTNTFLYNGPQPDIEVPEGLYPTVITQPSGKKVPVVQAYAYTKYMGQLNLIIGEDGKVKSYAGQPLLLNSVIPQDSDVLQVERK